MFSIDEGTVKILRKVYPELKERVIHIMTQMWYQKKIQIRVTQGFRSFSEQLQLYNKGRLLPGQKVTNAKPGFSYHNYGLAVDFCFRGKDPYLKNHKEGSQLWEFLGKLIKDSGCFWGGDFKVKDLPHAELRVPGYTPQECLKVYEKYGMRGLWIELDRALGREPGENYDLIPENE